MDHIYVLLLSYFIIVVICILSLYPGVIYVNIHNYTGIPEHATFGDLLPLVSYFLTTLDLLVQIRSFGPKDLTPQLRT